MNPDHGDMMRLPDEVWPDDVEPGTFDIETGTIDGYPQASGHIIFVCPNGKRCVVLLGPTAVGRDEAAGRRLCIWGWNGDLERPTLTPSINCVAEKDGRLTGGCGWHGFITNGVMR